MATADAVTTALDGVADATASLVPSSQTEERAGSEFLLKAVRNAAVRPRGYRSRGIQSHPKVVEYFVERLDNISVNPSDDWAIRTFGSADAGDGGVSAEVNKDYTNVVSGVRQSGETDEYSFKLSIPANPANGRVTSQIERDLVAAEQDWTGGDTDSALYVWCRFLIEEEMLPQAFAVYFEPYKASGGIGLKKLFEMRRDGSDNALWGPGVFETQYRVPDDERAGLSSVTRLRLQANFENNDIPSWLTLDRFAVRAAPNAPKGIALRDDDGYGGSYERAKWLAAEGIPCSFAIHPALVGTTGYMTLSQLLELKYEMGHEIVNHGWNKFAGDATSGDVLSLYDMDDETYRLHLLKAADWMYANGLEDGALVHVVHQGNTSPARVRLDRSLGFKLTSNTSGFRLNGSSEDIHNFGLPANGQMWHGMEVNNGYNSTTKTFSGSGMWQELDNEHLRPGDIVIPYGHGLDIVADSTGAPDMNRIERLVEAIEDDTYGGRGGWYTLPDLANGLHWH